MSKRASRELTGVAQRSSQPAVESTSGHNRSLYRFRIRDWRQGMLPVNLPGNAEVSEISIAGLSLPPENLRLERIGGRTVCWLTLPAGPDWKVRVEILFSADSDSWLLATRLEPAIPELPIKPDWTRTVWRLPPDVLPISVTEDRLACARPAGDHVALDCIYLGFPKHWKARPTNSANGRTIRQAGSFPH